MALLVAVILFITEVVIASSYINSLLCLLIGSGLMFFLSLSIYLSVKLFLIGTHPTLGAFILFSKVPVLITTIYLLFRWQGLDIISFTLGVLILLPCLVIVSYRKM